MPFGHQLTTSVCCLIELEFVIDDVDCLRNGVDTSLECDLIVQEHWFVEIDVLWLDHDVGGGVNSYEKKIINGQLEDE